MRIFGITGGSGSGKTTVSALLREMGAEIIDLDKISRTVTEKGSECLCELCDAFGREILTSEGELNRRLLANIAFADKHKTALLNRITHKYIKSETLRRIEKSNSEIIGLDGAVIIGSPVEDLCEKIVFVTADNNTRRERIMKRDGITKEEAGRRIAAQPDEEFYKKNSDYVVNNSGDTAKLYEQVHRLYYKLQGV